MGLVVEFVVLLLLVGALVLVIGPRLMKRGPRGSGPQGAAGAPGTLLITGVSPRPEAEGQQYVTIAGVITGPTVSEHVVYQQMAVDVTQWPTIGALIPVIYSPKNPDKWSFAPPEQQLN
ncbi:hypothetical protein BH09ACT7_BH09ACT7_12420 [soil metagenome]